MHCARQACSRRSRLESGRGGPGLSCVGSRSLWIEGRWPLWRLSSWLQRMVHHHDFRIGLWHSRCLVGADAVVDAILKVAGSRVEHQHGYGSHEGCKIDD